MSVMDRRTEDRARAEHASGDGHGDHNSHDDHDDPDPPLSFSFGGRSARPSLLAESCLGTNDGQASVELASIITVASNPVSSGLTSSPLDQGHTSGFIPPARPSSTPFPQPEYRADDLRYLGYSKDDEYEKDEDAVYVEPDEEVMALDNEITAEGVLELDHDADADDETTASYTTAADRMELDVAAKENDSDADVKSDTAEYHDAFDYDGMGFDTENSGGQLEGTVDAVRSDNGGTRCTFANIQMALPAAVSIGSPSVTLRHPPPDVDDDTDTQVREPTQSPFSTQSCVASAPGSPSYGSDACVQLWAVTDTTVLAATTDDNKVAPLVALPKAKPQTLFLQYLPVEVQELILDFVFDCRISATAKIAPDKRSTRLACISLVWRELIQARLYAYIKIKATHGSLAEVQTYFNQRPHLRSYVRHVELWFPVFQPKATIAARTVVPLATQDMPSNTAYTLPSDNATLDKAFCVLRETFPNIKILTLEGGERKKAPQVHFFTPVQAASNNSRPLRAKIPAIQSIRVLICKGQWNIIRCEDDFRSISAALPGLQEWRAAYSKPKSKSYLSMARILRDIPANLTSLNICLEPDYRQEPSFPPYFLKVSSQVHFCTRLAEAAPALKHLSYTGRVCRTFFDVLYCLSDARTTQLRSIDLTVKNCCRMVGHWHESGSGITNFNFIMAFEALVLSAARAMDRLTQLEFLRIRYVDLEFPIPPLNPYFLVRNGRASGAWSDAIVAQLNRSRPDVQWEELSDQMGEMTVCKDGRVVLNPEFPKSRVVSLKLSNYPVLAALMAL